MRFSKFYLIPLFIIPLAGIILFFSNDQSVSGPGQNNLLEKIAESSGLALPEKETPALPPVIRAIYYTGWSAGMNSRVNSLIELSKKSEINAVVIDIKDYSGYVAYDANIPDLDKYKAKEIKIKDIDGLIKKLHDEKIYVIARITIFQDPVLAKARPDLAVHRKSKMSALSDFSADSLWVDKKGLAWMDPTAKEVWDYNIAIAKDASSRGFDELNFDYIRFPSDGNLEDMRFPVYKETIAKSVEIAKFFAYLRKELPTEKISADLFGLSTFESGDLGIGQVIEDAYRYFDFVSPMVYPSHYANGFNGYKNPAKYPYEVIKYSMEKALARLVPRPVPETNSSSTTSTLQSAEKIRLQNEFKKDFRAKLRPWLQDFDLGADYDAGMVKAEIRAVKDALGENYTGYYMWSPSNNYTTDALINN